MNVKTYAKARKLTLKQVNDLCNVVLEQVPATLTETQISRLDAALAAAAEKVAALPAANEPEDTTGAESSGDAMPSGLIAELTDDKEPAAGQEDTLSRLDDSPSVNMVQTNQVIEVLGEDLLRRNVTIFLTHHIKSLQRLSETHNAILSRFEEDIYHQTAETLGRMTRNVETAFATAERIANPQTKEDAQLYQDYLNLVNDFLSTPPSNP